MIESSGLINDHLLDDAYIYICVHLYTHTFNAMHSSIAVKCLFTITDAIANGEPIVKELANPMPNWNSPQGAKCPRL